MSYCRWSSDKFKSDVYVYECVDGSWTTHVAGTKCVGEYPGPDPYCADEITKLQTDRKAWMDNYNAFHEWMDGAERAPVGPPYGGETFRDPSPGACADTLERIRAAGYHVPDGVIEELREEHKTFDIEKHQSQIRKYIEEDLK